MRLELRNIGIIEETDVDIDGLTVIAGDNDTSKSTIGKVAYSLTKAYEDFEFNYARERNKKIQRKLFEIFRLIRRRVNLREHKYLTETMDSLGLRFGKFRGYC